MASLRVSSLLVVSATASNELHTAVTQTCSTAALIHRCHVRNLRNMLDLVAEFQHRTGQSHQRLRCAGRGSADSQERLTSRATIPAREAVRSGWCSYATGHPPFVRRADILATTSCNSGNISPPQKWEKLGGICILCGTVGTGTAFARHLS